MWLGVDWRDRRLIDVYRLYMNHSVVIRISSLYSDACKLGRGVRQGCPLSPLLFNIYIQQLIAEALENDRRWSESQRIVGESHAIF